MQLHLEKQKNKKSLIEDVIRFQRAACQMPWRHDKRSERRKSLLLTHDNLLVSHPNQHNTGKVAPFVPPPEGGRLHLSQAVLVPAKEKEGIEGGGNGDLHCLVFYRARGEGSSGGEKGRASSPELALAALRCGSASASSSCDNVPLDLIFDEYTGEKMEKREERKEEPNSSATACKPLLLTSTQKKLGKKTEFRLEVRGAKSNAVDGVQVHLTGYHLPDYGGEDEGCGHDHGGEEEEEEELSDEEDLALARLADGSKGALYDSESEDEMLSEDDESESGSDDDDDDGDDSESDLSGSDSESESEEEEEKRATVPSTVVIEELDEGSSSSDSESDGEDDDSEEEGSGDDEPDNEPVAAAPAWGGEEREDGGNAKRKAASDVSSDGDDANKKKKPATAAAAAAAAASAPTTPPAAASVAASAKAAAAEANKNTKQQLAQKEQAQKLKEQQQLAQKEQAQKLKEQQQLAAKLREQQQQQQQQADRVRRFDNGFVIETLASSKSANAPLAKAGKRIKVRYVGKLAKTGKIFDQTKGAATFSFRLGVGEVIKGWDRGCEGMRVGDKRRLTVPPQMAYGSSGVRGAIPGNATLVFDVELVGVQ